MDILDRLYKQLELLSQHKDFNESCTIIDILEAISGDSDSPNAAYCLVNKCATVLNAVSDEIIASMPDDKRINIAKYLDKQAERYMTANV